MRPVASRPSDVARPRGGFTLLEMMLVVALLVAMFGISWPLMQRAYNDLKIRKASENVRLKLAGSRIHAVDAGFTYQFRYEPNGRRYLVVPYENLPQSSPQVGGIRNSQAGDSSLFREANELPEGLVFQSGGERERVLDIDESVLAGLPDASRLADVAWSLPMLFYFDGTADESKFRIVDEKKQFVEISVRELTGFVELSGVQREKRR